MRRVRMSSQERVIRSELSKRLHFREILRGRLELRRVTCGNANCKCADGDKHPAFYLVRRENGKVRQAYIPKRLERHIKQWVKQTNEIDILLDRLSKLYWQRVGEMKKSQEE